MEKEIKVLLLEDDTALCESFVKCFEDMEGIVLSSVTNSVQKALEDIRNLRPDAVILDLELHLGQGDGLTFLSKLGKMKEIDKPYVLVNTNNSSQITYEIVRNLGADYVFYKHTLGNTPEMIAEFLIIAVNHKELRNTDNTASATEESQSTRDCAEVRKKIADELNKVSINPKRKGYQYLADAIEIYIGGAVVNVSELIGQKYGKKAKSVERAMQTAIDEAWDNSDPDELGKYYKARYSANRLSPTVKEFISYYAAKIGKDC